MYLHRPSHSRHKPCAIFKPSANPQPGPSCPALAVPSGWPGSSAGATSSPTGHTGGSPPSQRLPLLLWLQPLQADSGPDFPVQSHILNCPQTLPLRHAAVLNVKAPGTQADSDGKPAPLHSPGIPTARRSPGPPASPLHSSFSRSTTPILAQAIFSLFLPMYRYNACQHSTFLQ